MILSPHGAILAAMKQTYSVHIYKEYLNFCSAHFLVFGTGDREELHGHNYRVECKIEGDLYPGADLYLDFRDVKPIVKKICDNLDHRVLLPTENKYLEILEEEGSIRVAFGEKTRWVFPIGDVCKLEMPNTSAELLAKYICRETFVALAEQYPQVLVKKVEFAVEEAPGQSASYLQDFGDGVPVVEVAELV